MSHYAHYLQIPEVIPDLASGSVAGTHHVDDGSETFNPRGSSEPVK
jgi:hypothetical protein